MTVRVERTFELAAPPERVWDIIADPDNRAEAISVVNDWEIHDDQRATWYLDLPIPFVSQTVSIETQDVEREHNQRVKFVGRSAVMRVTGEHELRPLDGGDRTELINRFVVEGRVPGVERFFKRRLDTELENLQAMVERKLSTEA
ncbi:MAG: SRPBCC family protein [Halobacteriales archaeon]|nr:SRPBCC family protein [Halobacteriales archaeon]